MDSMLSLSEAKKHLSDKMKRPLWDGEKDVDDPLFTALCKTEKSFNSSLHQHLNRWVTDNNKTITKNDEGDILYPQDFLDDFAAHRNRPNIPDGYVLENSLPTNEKKCIFRLNGFLREDALGLPVLDKNGCQRVAYPKNLIEIALASESGTNSSEIVREYGQYLDAPIQTTGACMDVSSSSLALENERFHAYMNRLTQLEPS